MNRAQDICSKLLTINKIKHSATIVWKSQLIYFYRKNDNRDMIIRTGILQNLTQPMRGKRKLEKCQMNCVLCTLTYTAD